MRHSIDDLSSTLASLAATIGAAAFCLSASPAEAMQQAANHAAHGVQQAERLMQGGNNPSNGNHFQVVDISPEVEALWIRRVTLGHAPELPVEIGVLASAQVAALYLSAASHSIDLGGSNGSFTVLFTGNLGSRMLTFSSGTTLYQMAAAINSYSDITDVHSIASATGLRLESMNRGRGAFVSVQVIDDGNIQGWNAGLYAMMPTDMNIADPGSMQPFWAPWPTLDQGQDLQATLNGSPVNCKGATIRARLNWITADIRIRHDGTAAQTIGAFQAFRILPDP